MSDAFHYEALLDRDKSAWENWKKTMNQKKGEKGKGIKTR